MKNCHCDTETNRDGSGQLGRYLKALDPSYAPIDGRSIEELLVFAKRYAAQIRFYDIPESKIEDGNPPSKASWKEFFSRDMAVIAASIALIDLGQIKKDYEETRARLEVDPEVDVFVALFKPIIGIAVRLDRWYSLAIPANPLKEDLELGIQSELKHQLRKIIAYEEGFKYASPKTPLKLDYSEIENDATWGLNDTVDPDASIYEGATLENKIQHASLFVDDIFNSFYAFISQLVDNSDDYLAFALEEYPSHQPHMALFITFLKLFQLAQEQANGLTERMLNFYYREVLHLTEKPSVPDRAHIVFELAKGVTEYHVEVGTELKGGKDVLGKEQIYETMSDLVVNQAKVKELKTVFIEKSPVNALQENKTIQTIYARPVANSLDGYGEKFQTPNSKWPTFGKGSPTARVPQNICQEIEQFKEELITKNEAKIGFALASPQLVLQGGNRLISWKLDGLNEIFRDKKEDPANNDFNQKDIELWLSAEDGWLTITNELNDFYFSQLLDESGRVFTNESKASTGYYMEKGTNTFHIFLPVSEKGIIAFDPEIHTGNTFHTPYPVLQILLGPDVDIHHSKYKKLRFNDLSLKVKVGSINEPFDDSGNDSTGANGVNDSYVVTNGFSDGLKKLYIQTSAGVVPKPNEAFDPFGLSVQRGSSFYIGSDEVFNKPVHELSINIKFASDNINDLAFRTDFFTNSRAFDYISASLLEGNQWLALKKPDGDDFTFNELSQNILQTPSGVRQVSSYITQRTPIVYNNLFNGNQTKGFIQLTNNLPIRTQDYKSRALVGQEISPYIQIKEVSISYHSNLQHLDPAIDQFFHVVPFGVVETYTQPYKPNQEEIRKKRSAHNNVDERIELLNQFKKLDEAKGYLLVDAKETLLPQFTYLSPYAKYTSERDKSTRNNKASANSKRSGNVILPEDREYTAIEKLMIEASGVKESLKGYNNQYSGELQEEGILYIGLENLKPLQSLSLLFQFAEGSALDEDNDPPPIHWSYLTNNEWRPLRGENIVYDGTFGFQTTGIVKIDVPADATNNNTIITSGLHWFSVSVTENAHRIPQLIDIVTQAVEAKFDDRGNAQSHFDKALPAGSIAKLVVAASEVGKVLQPFASYDGKPQEIGKEFHTRVSERLRHKARAINAWDYEHLILDRFPSIYKVKTLLHTDPNCLCRDTKQVTKVVEGDNGAESTIEKNVCCGPQVSPGHVLVVPIADLKNRNAANPLQPKTSRRTLLEIEEYLKKKTSPFVKLHAKNPVYEEVIVAFKVQFYSGRDKGFYLKKLNDEIVHYLTPWAFDDTTEVKFGQKIYASSIVNFIEERPYVDFITDFVMGVCSGGCCSKEGEDITRRDRSGSNSKNDAAEVLANICGCSDFEHLLQGEMDGNVVAKPSTPRSILVSVPKHIIIPYEPPLLESPCEKLERAKTAEGITREEITPANPAVIVNPAVVTTPTPLRSKKKPTK